MVEFNTIILKFGDQGEKTGWRYIDIPADIAQQLKPGNKKSFRVKGMLDGFAFAGIALMPMGDGNFIMALKADIRKAIHKREGAMLQVRLEVDNDYKVEMPVDLMECFDADPEAFAFFNSLIRSHRDYFIKWIDSAKTETTRIKRIVNTANATSRRMGYPKPLLMPPPRLLYAQVVKPRAHGRIVQVDNKVVFGDLQAMAEMLTYGVDLTAMTQGRGSFNMEMNHYDVVPAQLQDKIVEKARAARGDVKEEDE